MRLVVEKIQECFWSAISVRDGWVLEPFASFARIHAGKVSLLDSRLLQNDRISDVYRRSNANRWSAPLRSPLRRALIGPERTVYLPPRRGGGPSPVAPIHSGTSGWANFLIWFSQSGSFFGFFFLALVLVSRLGCLSLSPSIPLRGDPLKEGPGGACHPRSVGKIMTFEDRRET